MAVPLQPQLGLPHPQPGSSGDTLPYTGADNLDDPSHRWVKNLSNTPLTQAQRSLLAKGSNYVIAPRHPPHLEWHYCHRSSIPKINQQDAEELRASINRVLKKFQPPNLISTRQNNKTIKNILVSPKDKDPVENKSGAIYWFQCGKLVCNEEYIGDL